MRRRVFLFVALLTLPLALIGVRPAQAQLPEPPPSDPNAIPAWLIAYLLAELPPGTIPPPAIDGVQGAAVPAPGSANASVVEIPGLVTIGKSESNKTGSRVTVLSVAGQDLLVREGTPDGGTYTGPFAPIGDAVDEVNTALCPQGPNSTAPSDTGCVVLLYSDARTNQPAPGFSRTNSAQFRAVSITLPDGSTSLFVGATSASTTVTPFFPSSLCTDVATSFLIGGTGPLLALALVNPGGPAVVVSFLKPC
jgi:hypothetical protein